MHTLVCVNVCAGVLLVCACVAAACSRLFKDSSTHVTIRQREVAVNINALYRKYFSTLLVEKLFEV